MQPGTKADQEEVAFSPVGIPGTRSFCTWYYIPQPK